MKKRLLSSVLWFYVGWTFGAMVAVALSVHALLGPVIGLAAATLFAWDPRKIIWTTVAPTDRSEATN